MRVVLKAVLLLALGAPVAHAKGAQDDLVWRPDPHEDFALAPRVGAAWPKIDSDLSGIDAEGEGNRRDCLSDGSEYANWSRDVDATMTGPRFLGLTVTDSYYCGGPHPDIAVWPITWDRQTDAPMDWNALWPDAQVKPVRVSSRALPQSAVSMSPALAAWFRARVRARAAGDPAWLAECDAHYGADEVGDGVVLWLDAKNEGVGMDLAWLAHAEKGCGSPMVMPLEEATRLGAARELTDAVRAAHQGGGWRIDEDIEQ